MKHFITKLYLVVFMLTLSSAIFAQGKVTGKLIDADTKEPLVGAAAVVQGTTTGTVSSLNGTFELSLDNGEYTLVFSYLGYVQQSKSITVNGDLNIGEIALASDAVGIDEVSVIASVAVDRKTPVALSTMTPKTIEEKLGTQEFPEILKSTPSVYATKSGGGFGDGRINVRGFDSPNVAVMINGVPVNDMEWGGIYWSNWSGMGDVTRSMQVQRGLGASKVAVPSVGGSINILTKTTDAEKGGTAYTAMGNDGYKKVSFSVSTGLTENGWAVTLLGAKTTGDGYILGTEFEGYSYFFNVSKKINDNQTLSLTGFGAKQWHYQRSSYDKLTIAEWKGGKYTYGDKVLNFKEQYKFNPTYGFGHGGVRKTSYKNYYNKPQFSLNHFWNINGKSHLSSSLYASVGNGGGYSSQGTNKSWLYGTNGTYRTAEGYLDYAAIQDVNAASSTGSEAIISSSNNSHRWAGLISTYSTKVNNFDIYGGVDLRYYEGDHNNTIVDLLDGDYYLDSYRANVDYKSDDDAYVNKKLGIDDTIYRDYVGHVIWEGGFAQAEYNHGRLSAFLSGAISNTGYWRVDNMYYAKDEKKSDKINFLGYSVKGGANYNLTDIHNVFANIGYFSRAPYFSSVFLSKNNSNSINTDAENEKIFSVELGYGLRTSKVFANVNVYRTEWRDKSFTSAYDTQDPDKGTINALGVNALHQGVEFDIKYKPLKNLEITGMASYGDWKWEDDVDAYMMDSNGSLVDSDGNVVDTKEEAETVHLNIGGVHIGDAAQTTAALGVNYDFMDCFRIGVDYNYYDRLFADYGDVDDLSGTDTWQVPSASVFDANASYKFDFGGFKASLYSKINNLFDAVYITDAESGSGATWDEATVFYGFGRTWSVGLKLNF